MHYTPITNHTSRKIEANCKATALWWAREALSWRDEMNYAARCSSPAGWTKMATVDQCHKRSSICGKRSASSKTGGYL